MPSNTQTLTIPSANGDNHKWLVLGTVMAGLFMVVLDSSIINVALPHMITAFSTNTDHIRWVSEAYMISNAIFTLNTSWLREKIGIRFTFIVGLVIFTLSSFLCAISWNLESMIMFRVLQGIGGGIMTPTGYTLVTETFPPSQRGAAFGVFGIVIVFAPSLGPTLGGYLVDRVEWPFIFYINIPIGIITFFIALQIIKETRPLAPKTFDFLGFAGLSVFLGCLLTALTEGQSKGWKSNEIVFLYAVAAAGLILFLIAAPRAKNPILNIDIFKNFYFSLISILNIARAIALFGRMFLLPIFFQSLIGYSAMTSGILLAPGALVSGIIMPISGPLVDRYGPKIFILAGFTFLGISSLMYYNLDVTTPYSAILLPLIIFGIGSGLLNSPITVTAMNVVKKEYIGNVSTILSIIMQVGGAFGVAILGTLTNDRAAFHQAVYAENFSQYSFAATNAVATIQSLGNRIGESQYLTELQALPIINGFITKQSVIAGYQDAFVYTGIFCFLCLIPSLGLLTLKHRRGMPPRQGAPEKKEAFIAGE